MGAVLRPWCARLCRRGATFVLICANAKGTACGLPYLASAVDPWTAGITEAEEFGDFVEGFAGGVVDRAADERVCPGAVARVAREKVRVSAGDDEGER